MKRIVIAIALMLVVCGIASATCYPVVISTSSNKNDQGTGPVWHFNVDNANYGPGSTVTVTSSPMNLDWENTGYVLVPALFGGCTDDLNGQVFASFTVKDLNTGATVYANSHYVNFNCGFTYTCYFNVTWPSAEINNVLDHNYQVTESIHAHDGPAGLDSRTYTESIIIERR